MTGGGEIQAGDVRVQGDGGGAGVVKTGTVLPTWLGVLCVLGSVVGALAQNSGLPLWLVAMEDTPSGSNPYFVLTFASAAYVVVFGLVMGYLKLFTNQLGPLEAAFPHTFLALIGVCDALNGILVVFASPPTRTAPFLQAILGNSVIPMTFLGSWLILHRKTTWKHVACAALCVFGLLIALTPTIFGLNNVGSRYSSSASSRYVWPLVFMIGFVPAAVMNIFEEKVLKTVMASPDGGSEAAGLLGGSDGAVSPVGQLNIFFMLFWTSLYQLITCVVLFWVAIIPGFGVSTASEFPQMMWDDFACTMWAGAGCSWAPFFGAVFVAGYSLSYICGALLFRYASANFVVIAQVLSTPTNAVFWTLFQAQPFAFKPEANLTTWLALSSLPFLLGSIIGYHRLEAAEGDVDVDAVAVTGGHVEVVGTFRTHHEGSAFGEYDYHTV